jgi:hypothetical protein
MPVRLTLVLALATALLVSACGGGEEESRAVPAAAKSEAACPAEWRAGWQELADRIAAPVYCPGWIPQPLTGELDGQWNNIYSVDESDRSYLLGFTWYEVGSGEVHVNLRGYPESTEIPTCRETTTSGGKTRRKNVPCFTDSQGSKRIAGFDVTVYTRNRGADQWHVLYAWEEDGALYTLSQHVAPPTPYARVISNLERMLRSLVRVEPQTA